MFRLIVYFLIIVIVYMIGLSTGLDRQTVNESTQETNSPIELYSFPQDELYLNEQTSNEQYLIYEGHLNKEDHFTHKIANTLDTFVSAFYEIIIDILYNFANLFL